MLISAFVQRPEQPEPERPSSQSQSVTWRFDHSPWIEWNSINSDSALCGSLDRNVRAGRAAEPLAAVLRNDDGLDTLRRKFLERRSMSSVGAQFPQGC